MIFKDVQNNRPDDIFSIREYQPYWQDKYLKIKNDKFDNWSDKILDLKKDYNSAIQYFFQKLDPLLLYGFPIVVVPSHNPDARVTGICRLAKLLARNNRIDATQCLCRHKKIQKLSWGGDRSIELHFKSINVRYPELVLTREVLLLDDVTTTGNSLEACKQLLLQSGARQVQCVALGKTVR